MRLKKPFRAAEDAFVDASVAGIFNIFGVQWSKRSFNGLGTGDGMIALCFWAFGGVLIN